MTLTVTVDPNLELKAAFIFIQPNTTRMSGTRETEQYCIPTIAVPTKQYHLSYDARLLHLPLKHRRNRDLGK